MDNPTNPAVPGGPPEERPGPEVRFARQREDFRIEYTGSNRRISFDGRREHSDRALRTALVITAMLTTVTGPPLLVQVLADHAPWEVTVALVVCLVLLPLFYVLHGTRKP